MKTRSIFIVTALLLAVVVSACGGPTTVNQAAPVTPRTISVSGAGQAFLVPDIAYIYLGVHTEKPTASEAVAENNAQTQKVIDALIAFQIAEKDIRTTNFSIWPVDKYDPQTGTPTGEKTYSVDNTVYVTLRDIDKLGSLIDTIVEAGANTVNSIQFDVADKDEVLKDARADAMKNAAAQAQELAEAAGLQLGEIQSIQFNESQPYPIFEGKGGGGADVAASAVPIQPGQLTFSVTVNISYLIK